jgi:hypothetical protein
LPLLRTLTEIELYANQKKYIVVLPEYASISEVRRISLSTPTIHDSWLSRLIFLLHYLALVSKVGDHWSKGTHNPHIVCQVLNCLD